MRVRNIGKSGCMTKRKPELALARALQVNIAEYEFATILQNFFSSPFSWSSSCMSASRFPETIAAPIPQMIHETIKIQ